MLGYDPDFINADCSVPMPEAAAKLKPSVLRRPGLLREGIYYDQLHYTLVMDRFRRQVMFSACNIDQSRFQTQADGERSWWTDSRVGPDFQLSNRYYRDRSDGRGGTILNPYDKGHMVMRYNTMWGDTVSQADRAGKATFVYANAALQHENLNRDEWRELELNVVRKFSHDANDRLSVFTGPIYGSLDRHVNLSDTDSARIPSGFFKVICFEQAQPETDDKLGVLSFAIFQDEEVIRDKRGRSSVKTNRAYQVTISEIQKLTGLKFDRRLYVQNPLYFHQLSVDRAGQFVAGVPERIPTVTTDNIIPNYHADRCKIFELHERPIVLQSAMIDPDGIDQGREWISLHNRTARSISIDDWILTDNGGRSARLKGAIGTGQSIKLTQRQLGTIRLSNSGGDLMLQDPHDCIVDHVSWSLHQLQANGRGVSYLFPQ